MIPENLRSEIEKPREGYLELNCEGTDSDGNQFLQCDMYFKKRNDTDIHVIEKSYLDKLVAQYEARLAEKEKELNLVQESHKRQCDLNDKAWEKNQNLEDDLDEITKKYAYWKSNYCSAVSNIEYQNLLDSEKKYFRKTNGK